MVPAESRCEQSIDVLIAEMSALFDQSLRQARQRRRLPDARLTANRRGALAAWEQPALLAEELREGFRSLRK
jgi:hypothetical protein